MVAATQQLQTKEVDAKHHQLTQGVSLANRLDSISISFSDRTSWFSEGMRGAYSDSRLRIPAIGKTEYQTLTRPATEQHPANNILIDNERINNSAAAN